MAKCGTCDTVVNGPLTPIALGAPVESSRLFTDGFVPNARGGHNWIGCFNNDPQPVPAEWIVLDTATGAQTVDQDNPDPGKRGKPGSQQYRIKHQLRAPNGCVFWPGTSAVNWVYDPRDERMHFLGRVPNGNGVIVTDAAGYSMVFNTDGSWLYGGTTAAGGTDKRPMLYSLNPNTWEAEALLRLGGNAHTQPGWAYFLWAVGDWVYGIVGKDFFECVAVHVPTKTQTILFTEMDHPQMFFVQKPEGLVLQSYTYRLQTNQTLKEFLLDDGKLYPYVAGQQPFPWRDVTPYANPVLDLPEVDETPVPNGIRVRPKGSTGTWKYLPIHINYALPIPIDSLTALPDDTVLFSVENYLGFGKFSLQSGETTTFGPWDGISEGNARVIVDGKLYMSGYPPRLEEYDPTQPWSPTNPKLLGSFSDGVNLAGTKRTNVLVYRDGRIYSAGQREREGSGAGVGYYDFVTKKFAGHYAGLEMITGHLGLACVGDRVVLGGNTPQLVVHDMNLAELVRFSLPELTETGKLFNVTGTTRVVGVSVADGKAYSFDLDTMKFEAVDLSAFGPVGVVSQDIYGNVTLVAGPDPAHGSTSVLQLDLVDVQRVTLIGRVPDGAPISRIAQVNCDLYMARGAELFVFSGVLPT